MIKKYYKHIIFICFVILIVIVCNLVAAILIDNERAIEILSIVSTVISIVLSLIAIFYTFISGIEVSSSLQKINLQIHDAAKYQQQLSATYEKLVDYRNSIVNGQATDEDSIEIDAEMEKLKKSMDKYFDMYS